MKTILLVVFVDVSKNYCNTMQIFVIKTIDSISDDLSNVICADTNLVLLLDAIESRKSFKENTTDDETFKKMADTLVLITSNGT